MAPVPAQPPSIATASLIVKWNTQSTPAPVAIQYGTLTAIDGTRVSVRMRDGTIRSFTASNSDTTRLRALLGKVIAFRVR